MQAELSPDQQTWLLASMNRLAELMEEQARTRDTQPGTPVVGRVVNFAKVLSGRDFYSVAPREMYELFERAMAELTGEASAGGKTTDRRAAVDTYIEEVFSQKGKRITRTDIWKSARYKSRTEFERWERHDRRATKTANERFTRILTEKPHLK
jgi:hypothetical protein